MRIQETLSDKELLELQRFIDNPVMKNAVKKVLLYQIYTSGTLQPDKDPEPFTNFALSFAQKEGATDEQIGRLLRAALEGTMMVEAGFRDIDKLKTAEEKVKDVINKAR